MAFGRSCVPLVTLGLGAALLTGCASTPVLHGGKLGPRYGVQVGYFMPVEEGEQAYRIEPTPNFVGMTVRLGADLATPWGGEIGAAFSRLAGEDASVDLFFLRARGLYTLGVGGLCLSAGVQRIEQKPTEADEQLKSFVGAAIDIGVIKFFGRGGEMGLNYSILVGSENVPGTLEVTAGINF